MPAFNITVQQDARDDGSSEDHPAEVKPESSVAKVDSDHSAEEATSALDAGGASTQVSSNNLTSSESAEGAVFNFACGSICGPSSGWVNSAANDTAHAVLFITGVPFACAVSASAHTLVSPIYLGQWIYSKATGSTQNTSVYDGVNDVSARTGLAVGTVIGGAVGSTIFLGGHALMSPVYFGQWVFRARPRST